MSRRLRSSVPMFRTLNGTPCLCISRRLVPEFLRWPGLPAKDIALNDFTNLVKNIPIAREDVSTASICKCFCWMKLSSMVDSSSPC